MRLLTHANDEGFAFSKYFTSDEEIPSYAILSHIWKDGEEVTFDELKSGTGESKEGYKKIELCAQQAKRDGLQYFWVDTCCIKKSDPIELRKAINSMFRWYRNAVRCYVFLPDVSTLKQKDVSNETWEPAFRVSRWFTRGWTLQELLAPVSVEFFSLQWMKLGDKRSLSQQIHGATGIPESLLQGKTSLFQFSVTDRLSWKENRQTKLEEDRAYSLIGIFGVQLAPIYGEGAKEAFRRLLKEVERLEKCIRNLYLTNPSDDKKRIEETKGGLLKDSYRWVLETPDFKQWRNESRILWVKGDPGKGKTMLLCGLVEELKSSPANAHLLSYFFCQSTDSRINNATAVLRGLMYMLVIQQPFLAVHIQQKHDHAGRALFNDSNAWVVLYEMFTNMLEDPHLTRTYLLIDALDECTEGLPRLLEFIVQRSSSASSRAKWIVSSRNLPDINDQLASAAVMLSLELNIQSVSVAVNSFIERKVFQLAERRKYSDKTRHAVLEYLTSNAEGTFLWVALVCQRLEQVCRRNVIAALNRIPPGLDALYERMMERIRSSDDAGLCKQILALVATVYQPIMLQELITLVEKLDEEADDPDSIDEIIGQCGSFLTVRDNTIFFVHQSAKEFVCKKISAEIFPTGKEETHRVILSRSLHVMSSAALHRDMYNLIKAGYPVKKVRPPDPDPLAPLRYSCIYWIDHLCDCDLDSHAPKYLAKGGAIDVFLSTKYLYWLETLSLCEDMSKGVRSMAKLASLVQESKHAFSVKELVYDALRFIMYHRAPIESYPLQTYVSALLYSPTHSLIRQLFEEEAPTWVTIMPSMQHEWNACLQTLEGHSSVVLLVIFSHHSKQLASATSDEIKIWDAGSGHCSQTMKVQDRITSLAFSHDSKKLVTVSNQGTVRIWNTLDGKCLHVLQWPTVSGSQEPSRHPISFFNTVKFSHDSVQLVSTCSSKLALWDLSDVKCHHRLEGHDDEVMSVSFSLSSELLASGSWDESLKIWHTGSGSCLQTLECNDPVLSTIFLHDSALLVSSTMSNITIWNWKSGSRTKVFGDNFGASSLAVSHDLMQLASASSEAVRIWDLNTGNCVQALEGLRDVFSPSFSHDLKRFASTPFGRASANIWDLTHSNQTRALQGHNEHHNVFDRAMELSRNTEHVALVEDKTIVEIWDVRNGECIHKLEGHSDTILLVVFSPDSTQLASVSIDNTIKLWDLGTGKCLQTVDGHNDVVRAVAFSPNSTHLVSRSSDRTYKIWDIKSIECLQTFNNTALYGRASGAFSLDSSQLAVESDRGTVKIWNINSGESIQTIEVQQNFIDSMAFTPDSKQLAVCTETDNIVSIWDVGKGICLHTIECTDEIRQMSFDTTSLYLYTNIGAIDINASLRDADVGLSESKPPQARYRGLAVLSRGDWITYNSHNLVWIPSEFRAKHKWLVQVKDSVVSIFDASDRLWMYSFDLDRLSQAQG